MSRYHLFFREGYYGNGIRDNIKKPGIVLTDIPGTIVLLE